MQDTLRTSPLFIGRVRPIVWVPLTLALVLAVATPLLVLRHAAASPISARAYIWPATPRLGAPTYLAVAIDDAADRSAMQGPWAEMVVRWDMPTMPMGTQPLVVTGPPSGTARHVTFTAPLQFNMAGQWRVSVAIRTPGRPAWHTSLVVSVLPPPTSPPSPTAQGAGATLAGALPEPHVEASRREPCWLHANESV